ncbi:MAG: hypothetical protein ACRDRI_22135 [Pseudonocardiaceae bacterium]
MIPRPEGGVDERRRAVPEPRQPPDDPQHLQTHRGPVGFCNLQLTKVNGTIVFDPHVAGCCVITLDEAQAKAVRNTLTEWLG